MAPFKLKFRMGSSRSTSQEHDPDPQVNEALLTHHAAAIGASSSTIDSADCHSLGSMGTNERKSLLPNKTNNLRLGYLNHNLSHSKNESLLAAVPTTPPPSYEHVLEENTRLANNFDFHHTSQMSGNGDQTNQQHQSQRNSRHLSSYETPCDDPDCQENYLHNEQLRERERERDHASLQDDEADIDNRKESIDSRELLIAGAMTTQDHQLDNCTNENCPQQQQQQQQQQQYESNDGGACGVDCTGGHNDNSNFCDPLMNHNGYCSGDHSQHHSPPDYMDRRCETDSDDGWDINHQQHLQQQQQQQQQQHEQQQLSERSLTPEIISNKSSKEIYKDLAKQWGITCKMSDGCRCMECQSHYFDCEFDDNEHQKTDGGLGAGTPMFISEVMHGSACTIL